MEKFLEDLVGSIKNLGINFLFGILILVVGLIVCRIIKIVLKKIFSRRKKDEAISSFVISFIDVILKIIIMIAALATMGVNTTSIITVVGTCGLAIGLALKDSLGNLASGMIIIFNKPFKKNDYIEVGGVAGQVLSINLFNTTLLTFDNKRIVVPNSTAVNNPIVNADGSSTRRVDIDFQTQKGIELQQVKDLAGMLAKADQRVLATPTFSVRLSGQTENALIFTLKVWVMTKNYWDVYYDLSESVYETMLKANISAPNRQIDVSMANEQDRTVKISANMKKAIKDADNFAKETADKRVLNADANTDIFEVAFDKLANNIEKTYKNGSKKKNKKNVENKEAELTNFTVKNDDILEKIATENTTEQAEDK